MFPIALIGGLLKEGLGLVGDHFKAKREQKARREEHVQKIEEAKVEATIKSIARSETAEIDWDIEAQRNSQSSWKDEWFTIVLSIPLVLCFVPGWGDYVAMGFAALSGTPLWYQSAVGIAIAASFGYRKLVDIMGKKNDKSS